jgi:hypothetical protein
MYVALFAPNPACVALGAIFKVIYYWLRNSILFAPPKPLSCL